MGWFNRKKNISLLQNNMPVLEHEHIWKDMPWYMNVRYNGNYHTAGYDIIEPYICVTCGERKNVKLESEDYSNITVEERKKIFSRVRNEYKKYLKPRAVVEDMINNILLVKDTHNLNMIEKLYGLPHQNCGSSSKMQMEENSEFKINLPERKIK